MPPPLPSQSMLSSIAPPETHIDPKRSAGRRRSSAGSTQEPREHFEDACYFSQDFIQAHSVSHIRNMAGARISQIHPDIYSKTTRPHDLNSKDR